MLRVMMLCAVTVSVYAMDRGSQSSTMTDPRTHVFEDPRFHRRQIMKKSSILPSITPSSPLLSSGLISEHTPSACWEPVLRCCERAFIAQLLCATDFAYSTFSCLFAQRQRPDDQVYDV